MKMKEIAPQLCVLIAGNATIHWYHTREHWSSRHGQQNYEVWDQCTILRNKSRNIKFNTNVSSSETIQGRKSKCHQRNVNLRLTFPYQDDSVIFYECKLCKNVPKWNSFTLLQVFVGLGFPYEGPAPLEAISQGCVFLNPRFIPPKNGKNTKFFQGKPTLRQVNIITIFFIIWMPQWHVFCLSSFVFSFCNFLLSYCLPT